VELMLFGKDFIEYNKYMVQGLFIFVKARVQERYNQPGSLEIKLSKIELLDEVKKNAFNLIKLRVRLNSLDEALVVRLEDLFNRYEGKSSLEFYVEDEEQQQNLKLFSKKNKIAIGTEFLTELEKFSELQYDLN
jgi:DNA polymerase-3 subunit alpha